MPKKENLKNKKERPNTRANDKETKTDQEMIDKPINITIKESEDNTTDIEETADETDNQEENEIKDKDLRSEILRLIKSKKDDHKLIAELRGFLEENGAAREKDIEKAKPENTEMVSEPTTKEKMTRSKTRGPAQNFERQPSFLQPATEMNTAEPIRMHHSKTLARKNTKNNKKYTYSSEESETDTEESSTELEIETPMRKLFKTFGTNLTISKETMKADNTKIQKRRTTAASRTPKIEPETESSEGEHYEGATAKRTSPSGFSREMTNAHAQMNTENYNELYEEGEHLKLISRIPTPFCNFQHLQDHGLPTVVSSGNNNIGNLPSDFPKLRIDGINLQEWCQQIQVVFMKENLLFFITNPPKRPWTLKMDCLHHRAFYLIISSISPAMYYSIKHNLTVSEIIQCMFKLFHSESVATTTRMSKDFFSAKLRSGITISEHLISLNKIRAELHLRGEIISEQTMKSVILNSLDSSWDNYISHLDSINLGYLSIESLSNKLIAEDNLRKSRYNAYTEHRQAKRVAFQENHQKTIECYNCGSRKHSKGDCPMFHRERQNRDYRGRYQDRQSSIDRYRYRDSPNYREHRKDRDNSRDRKSGSLNGLDKHNNVITQKSKNNAWLIDSGATNHTTNNKKILSSFTNDKFMIRVANQENVQVIGKGNVNIPGLGKIEGVLLIPEISHNILSAVKLSQDFNINIIFSRGKAILEKDGTKLNSVIIEGGLPFLVTEDKWLHNINANTDDDINIDSEHSNINDNEEPKTHYNHKDTPTSDTHNNRRPNIGKPIHDECAHMLHRKLGHASFPVIQKMIEHADGVKIKDCKNYLECSVCKSSKLRTNPKPKRATRTSNQIFDLVHMDLVGPLTPSITYKKRYFLTIVDDYSRYGFVYTLKHKDETFQKFKEFYKRVETQHNIKIKQIMTDRGSEFMSKEFSQWIKDKGMLHFTTSPFSSFQNGTVERKNSTLQTMIRCTLEDAGLGKQFWSEALLYSNYTQNRTWSSILNKTPYEVMYNRKPKISHMHIFGVTADVHIPKQLRRKGDNVSRRLRFMGYETGTKGYRFIDSNNKFIVSRTAVFHEQANWSKIHLNEIIQNTKPNIKQQDRIEREKHEHNTHDDKNKTWTGNHTRIKTDSLTKKEARYLHDNESIPIRTIRCNRNQLPNKYKDYIMCVNDEIPTPNTYKEVLKLPMEEREKWELAITREMNSLRELGVFTPVPAPKDKTIIGTRWIFKIKDLEEGNKLYKARLVAQGYAQKYPEDYTDTYSPTVRTESVKTALVIAAILNLDVFQYDVQTAYLHAKLDKEIYVRAPHSQYTNRDETWLLNKSLYGLKQSGKRWYECLVNVLKNMDFKATTADNCFFVRKEGESLEFVLIYVDDILYIGKHKEKKDLFVSKLSEHFSLKSLGKVNKYLGVQINKTRKGFKLSQRDKIIELLEKCNLRDAKPCDTPMQTDFLRNMDESSPEFENNTLYRSIIGSLLYISNWTRPDIALPLNLLSRHVSKPLMYHWEAVKRILRYLKHSIDFCLLLEPNNIKEPIITSYADADWAGDIKCRKSTSGYVLFLNGCPIFWYTGKQDLVATSTTEAEYVCLSKASNNLVWFNDLLSDIWKNPILPFVIHEDNKAAIEISRSDAIGQRSRHIDIKFKHVRQLSQDGFIKAIHCETSEQIADILTKPLPSKQHKYLTSKLQVLYSSESECNHCYISNRHLEGDLS